MPEKITRPNGKTYSPRRPPRVDHYTNHDEVACVVVIGTHDLDVAAQLAASLWDHHEPIPTGTRSWWRIVPWDTGTGYDRNWVTDETRGAPVVYFDPQD